MKDAQGNLVQGRTRWRRFAAVMVPAVAAASLLVVGIANGAIPASFAVSGSEFKVSADELDGTGFVQYGGFVSQAGGRILPNGLPDPTDSKNHAVAVSGIHEASLTKLCQSVVVPGTGISLVIHAGGNGTAATAENLLIDLTQLNGDASFGNITIGQDASTLDEGQPGAKGLPGFFGQQADTVKITHLTQIAWSTSAGTFNLNGLDLHVSLNKEECFPS
ncbi:DUF6230 family protein [Rugosimonospora acidiphila]|uniref:DUF6230 family protein n=1 Tax=Rugosimonospora acidiphila TaxID=556531 RepID=A0ABP9SK32_9ACTN